MQTAATTQRKAMVGGSLLFASVYLHYGVTTPFLPVWYEQAGFSAAEIGILLAIPMFAKIVVLAPVASAADSLRRVRDMTWLFTATAALLLFSIHYIESFWVMALVTALFALFWDPIPMLTDAYAVGAARDQKLDFGRMRVWASIAVVVSTLVGGWFLNSIGAQWTVWVAAGLLLVPLVVLPFLPSDRLFDGARPAAKGEWRSLLADTPMMLMIVAASLVIASHALLNGFSSIEWVRSGLSKTMVGALWATSFVSELAVLWFGRRLLGDRHPALLIVAGAAMAAIRWIFMAASVVGPALFGVQLLNGLSGVAPILGMMLFIERRVAPHLTANAQGLYASAWSAAMAVATIASGPLWRSFGNSAYLVMAVVAVAGGCVAVLAWRARGRTSTQFAPGGDPTESRRADTAPASTGQG